MDRCDDCRHAVDGHDLRGWHTDSTCRHQCRVCAAAEIGDRTYAQAVAEGIAAAFKAATAARVPVC